jgi:hypothetical protein
LFYCQSCKTPTRKSLPWQRLHWQFLHKTHTHTYLITNRILPYNFTILHSTVGRQVKDKWGWPLSTLCSYITKQFHIQTVKNCNSVILYIFRTTDITSMHWFVPLLYSIYWSPTCFGSILPSSGSFLDPSELLEILVQIEWVVYVSVSQPPDRGPVPGPGIN